MPRPLSKVPVADALKALLDSSAPSPGETVEGMRSRREAVGRRVLGLLCEADVSSLFGESGLEARPPGALEEALASALDPLVSEGAIAWWGGAEVTLEGGGESGLPAEPVLLVSVSLEAIALFEGRDATVPSAPFGLRMGVRQLRPGMGDVLEVMLS